MITHPFTRALSIALLAGFFTVSAMAGPGPQQVFVRVKTKTQAQEIPVGSQIALSCNNGPVTIVTVEKDRDYLKGFTCPVSKRLYRYSPGGGARGGDQFIYKSDDGFTAHLLTLGKL